MDKLKPCPFCGGKAYIAELGGNFYIDAFHKKNCLVKPDTYLLSIKTPIKKHIKAWNKRATNDQ